jgi:2-polyprenyl-3-methyl-5-hydroxy-6-metoxy-1,4-benzoquinol methylase
MKILVAIANYGTKNDVYLQKLLEQYRSLPYQKEIVVHTNIAKDLGTDVNVIVGLPTPDPRSLVYAHRRLFIENADKYDLFIYTEDDTLITQDNIEAFLEVTPYMPDGYVADFFHYAVSPKKSFHFGAFHGSYHWLPDSVKCFGSYTFAEFSNKHSASYLLSRSQLHIAINSGNYALTPQRSRYDILESAACDPFVYCGLTKVMCISQLDRFLVHHQSNKSVVLKRFDFPKEEVESQIKALMQVEAGSLSKLHLFETETKLLKRKFDKRYYEPSDSRIVKAVGSGCKNVLSVGCGTGETEADLVKKGHRVVAIPLDEIIAVTAQAKGIETVIPDFNEAIDRLSEQSFDCIIFPDVLQHLREPTTVLTRFANLLGEKGKIIATFLNRKCRKFSSEMFTPFDLAASGSVDFESLGIHLTNVEMVRSWFQRSGLGVQHVVYYIPPGRRMRMYNRLSLGLLAEQLAPRFMVIATKRK